ncbi:membrane protein [Candidatus Thiomargarita nelsonii]|uniref:Membrane protein n=1 Tax=Candidatus Thiomargarita nelsonii TaxID=1003181 RepID=A0A176RW58_9GAMM|nr:membrane protein [Candidatus Thiomargarita nelsonii]
MNERLNILGHVLVILIILAEIGNIFAREPREDSNVIMELLHYLSSNASIYTITVILVLLLFFSKAIKNRLKEFFNCWLKR